MSSGLQPARHAAGGAAVQQSAGCKCASMCCYFIASASYQEKLPNTGLSMSSARASVSSGQWRRVPWLRTQIRTLCSRFVEPRSSCCRSTCTRTCTSRADRGNQIDCTQMLPFEAAATQTTSTVSVHFTNCLLALDPGARRRRDRTRATVLLTDSVGRTQRHSYHVQA